MRCSILFILVLWVVAWPQSGLPSAWEKPNTRQLTRNRDISFVRCILRAAELDTLQARGDLAKVRAALDAALKIAPLGEQESVS